MNTARRVRSALIDGHALSESPVTGVHDVNGWIIAWCSAMAVAGLATATIRLRRSQVKRMHAEIDVATVTDEQLVAWLDDVTGDMAPNSRKSLVSTVRHYFRWLQRTGRRTDNPAEHLTPVRVPPGVPKPVPEAVFRRTWAHADDETRYMLALGYYGGLRRAEISRVHSNDVTDLGLVVHGKGGRMRLVPIHPQLRPFLEGTDGWAFPSPRRPGNPVTPDYVESRVTRALPRPHTTHALRHAFATRAYAACKDIRVVQQLLGHASVATTQVYVQVDGDALRAAVFAIA